MFTTKIKREFLGTPFPVIGHAQAAVLEKTSSHRLPSLMHPKPVLRFMRRGFR
jgi:hypothetical protein